MTNRRRTAWIMIPVLLIGLSAGIAWSQEGEGRRIGGSRIAKAESNKETGRRHWRARNKQRPQRNQGRSMKRIARKLDLTQEQLEQIKTVLTNTRKKGIAFRADARIARIELREMVSQMSIDKTNINAKVDEIAKIRADSLRVRTDATLAVRTILTLKQLAKADGMLKRVLRGRKGRGRR